MRQALIMFAQLSDRDVEWMSRNGQSVALPQGFPLIESGKPVHALYIVLEGTLSVMQGEARIARLAAGEVVGEISMIMQRAPSASVIADEPVRVLAIGKTHLLSHLARDVEFAANFYRGLTILLASRLRRTTQLLGYVREGDSIDAPTSAMSSGDGAFAGEPEGELEGELDADALDELSIANERFLRLLRQFA